MMNQHPKGFKNGVREATVRPNRSIVISGVTREPVSLLKLPGESVPGDPDRFYTDDSEFVRGYVQTVGKYPESH